MRRGTEFGITSGSTYRGIWTATVVPSSVDSICACPPSAVARSVIERGVNDTGTDPAATSFATRRTS